MTPAIKYLKIIIPAKAEGKGSRKNKVTFSALRFRLGLVYFKEQNAL